LSLSEFEWRAGTAGLEKRKMPKGIRKMGGEEPECPHQQNDKDYRTQSHGSKTSKPSLHRYGG
jgi:hypothetical protein